MSHTIVNLSQRPVSIRLNTGITRHIPPRASLSGLFSGEIDGNARISKLVRQRVIAVREAAAAGLRSRDMSANEAVEHIKRTAVADLGDFVAGEERVTVLRAFEEKTSSQD